MDIHTATELAYKNGYAKGYEDGKGEWISVEERLPKPDDKEPDFTEIVLFRTTQGHIYSGYRYIGRPQTSFYDDDWEPPCWLDESENVVLEEEYVTHWMPKPEDPKGEWI